MAAYRRVYDLRHLQADCQEPGSAPEHTTLGNRERATCCPLANKVKNVACWQVYACPSMIP